MFYTKTKKMKNLVFYFFAMIMMILNTSCTIDSISNIEDQYAAIGTPADALTSSKSSGYDDEDNDDYDDDDEYDEDDDHEENENNSQSISDAAMSAINAYISTNYPNTSIEEIEQEGSSIEVELSNGVELYFDLNGNFLGTDD